MRDLIDLSIGLIFGVASVAVVAFSVVAAFTLH